MWLTEINPTLNEVFPHVLDAYFYATNINKTGKQHGTSHKLRSLEWSRVAENILFSPCPTHDRTPIPPIQSGY
jgi:predicted RNase H-like nuclease